MLEVVELFEKLKLNVSKTTNVLERDNDANDKMFFEDEKVILHGYQGSVRRLCLNPNSDDLHYEVVGWIFDEDVTECMICGSCFSCCTYKHHCRACGNIVCNSCSPHNVIIVELKELNKVRVCTQCYWGQEEVHVVMIKNVLAEWTLQISPRLTNSSTTLKEHQFFYNGNNELTMEDEEDDEDDEYGGYRYEDQNQNSFNNLKFKKNERKKNNENVVFKYGNKSK
jgi:hypothetical protein